jgi:hypothetical protein
MPIPTAPAAWSPAPATIGVPATSPVSRAASADTVAETAGDSKTCGRMSSEMPDAASISADQARRATSSIRVPDASATSMAKAPLNLYRT